MCHFFIKICVGFFCRTTKSGDSRHIICPGTHPFLLASAQDQRMDLHSVSNIKESNSFWSMQLMSADREHINAKFFRINTVLSIGLDCIHMPECLWIFFFDDLPDLFDRLQSPDLIIDIHGGHQDRIFPDRIGKLLKIYSSIAVYRYVTDLKSLLLKIDHRLDHGSMFDRRCNNVFSGTFVCHRRSDQCPVV